MSVDLVTRVAKALCESYMGTRLNWEKCSVSDRDMDMARAAIAAMMPNEDPVVKALAKLVWYCQFHEGWQDDHEDILRNAQRILNERNVVWRFDESDSE